MKFKKKIKVAIDSPAGAGAGTQAKLISKHYNLFYLDTGKIYRPAQDCSNGYGYKVIVNQIITLNKMEYQEKEFHIIDPVCDSKLTGIHTFSHEKKLTVLDGKLKRRKL